jgi:hypothetical protein
MMFLIDARRDACALTIYIELMHVSLQQSKTSPYGPPLQEQQEASYDPPPISPFYLL